MTGIQQKKRAVILRHAQAQSPASAPTDAERPLTADGQLQALQLGRQWAKAEWVPELVIVSPAQRALETLAAVLRGLELPDFSYTVNSGFYLGGHHEMLVAMAQLEVEYDRLLFVGHNPGWSEAVTFLTGHYCSLETGQAMELVPQEAQLDWMTILASAGSCQLERVWR